MGFWFGARDLAFYVPSEFYRVLPFSGGVENRRPLVWEEKRPTCLSLTNVNAANLGQLVLALSAWKKKTDLFLSLVQNLDLPFSFPSLIFFSIPVP